ncbi:MAG: carbon-nitrogen hydrolase family protein [Ruminococcaceae bacterium]|jgi:predicted amidohydrolase|nr:carbon-nitrogen hydrolase family protein [Oscillospiraceae bacterium]
MAESVYTGKVRVLQRQLLVPERKEAALEELARSCAAAAEAGADLLTLPEMFCCPYESSRFGPEAEEEGGPVWRRCAELARSHGIYLSAGSVPERGEDGRVYNTAYVFDRQGRQIAKHRKAHLFDIDVPGGQRFFESDSLAAGSSVTTFDTEFGTMGLCVCYDIRFPELGRRMALAGARVILAPGAFNLTTGPLHWELVFRAQAMFNQCYALGTAPARDMAASYHSWGHTIAADPWGRVLAQMDEGDGVQLVELDLAEVEAVRAQIPLLRHRLPMDALACE